MACQGLKTIQKLNKITRMDTVPPPEVLETPPTAPPMSVLVYSRSSKSQDMPVPLIPAQVVQQWGLHPVHGAQFQALLDKHVEEFGDAVTGDEPKADDPEPGSNPGALMSQCFALKCC